MSGVGSHGSPTQVGDRDTLLTYIQSSAQCGWVSAQLVSAEKRRYPSSARKGSPATVGTCHTSDVTVHEDHGGIQGAAGCCRNRWRDSLPYTIGLLEWVPKRQRVPSTRSHHRLREAWFQQ